MPQTQALGQVVAGHRRKGHAGHQGAQPCQALHGLDVNHQTHRAALAQRLKHVPVWIFHGAKDDVVPPREDRLIEAAFKAAGGDVRYTEFPDANHNSWDPAYSGTPEFWPWLFAQHRN